MYVTAMVIPVPEANRAAYKRWAENSAALFMDYGCLEVMECWQDMVPRGSKTDFFRAVDAQEGENVLIAFQVWPSKEEFFAAEDRMHHDPQMEPEGEIPFDPSRLIHGCFSLFHHVRTQARAR